MPKNVRVFVWNFLIQRVFSVWLIEKLKVRKRKGSVFYGLEGNYQIAKPYSVADRFVLNIKVTFGQTIDI
jgi:hypothetical protein